MKKKAYESVEKIAFRDKDSTLFSPKSIWTAQDNCM